MWVFISHAYVVHCACAGAFRGDGLSPRWYALRGFRWHLCTFEDNEDCVEEGVVPGFCKQSTDDHGMAGCVIRMGPYALYLPPPFSLKPWQSVKGVRSLGLMASGVAPASAMFVQVAFVMLSHVFCSK